MPATSCVVRYRDCGICGTLYAAPGRDTNSKVCRPCRPAARLERRLSWAERHPAERARYQQRWRDANLHRLHAAKRLRYQMEASAPFTVSEIYERDGWVCQLCWVPVRSDLRYPDPQSASLDHVIPIARGGTHTPENVQLAHLVCNQRKQDRMPEEVCVGER